MQYPLYVILAILGLPESQWDRFIELGDRMIIDSDPEIAIHVAGSAEAEAYKYLPFGSEAAAELCAMGRETIDARRAPGCVFAEPRSDRKPRPRRTAVGADETGGARGCACGPPAIARGTDAVHGGGVGRVDAVAVLHVAPRARARGRDRPRDSRHRGRSEERRVGKECRSRWSPYH